MKVSRILASVGVSVALVIGASVPASALGVSTGDRLKPKSQTFAQVLKPRVPHYRAIGWTCRPVPSSLYYSCKNLHR